MAGIVSTRQAHAYHHASDLPHHVWQALSDNQAAANVILPFAEKARSFSREGDDKQWWVVLSDDANNVEFVLSCTKGPLGNYPIFIVVSKSVARRTEAEDGDQPLTDAVSALVLGLLNVVPPKRVFSVFSIAKVSKKFAELFVTEAHARQEHDIQIDKDYYDATFTFCTRETFNETLTFPFPVEDDEDITIAICRADSSHLEGVKVLCKAFSEISPPYKLNDDDARLEAKTMIDNGQVWVHLVKMGGQEPQVACLVATTRESDAVTAVTKVITAEAWQLRRCARRLLHRVCQEILGNQTKERVVLYVGKDLNAARSLYRNIGFQGLDGAPVEGVERWLEIGFKGTEPGYW